MIGINTHILLRLRLNDEPMQHRRIDVLLAAHGSRPGSLLVTDAVLAEAFWTLNPALDQDKPAQLLAVRRRWDETAFTAEYRAAVAAAPKLFESGCCGFADCLVFAQHARHGWDFRATLDLAINNKAALADAGVRCSVKMASSVRAAVACTACRLAAWAVRRRSQRCAGS